MEKTYTVRPTASARVIERLREEGWVDCPELPEYLCQPLLAEVELSKYVIQTLRQARGQLTLRDLNLECLTFSIQAHEFLVHPELSMVLENLQIGGIIQQQDARVYLL